MQKWIRNGSSGAALPAALVTGCGVGVGFLPSSFGRPFARVHLGISLLLNGLLVCQGGSEVPLDAAGQPPASHAGHTGGGNARNRCTKPAVPPASMAAAPFVGENVRVGLNNITSEVKMDIYIKISDEVFFLKKKGNKNCLSGYVTGRRCRWLPARLPRPP